MYVYMIQIKGYNSWDESALDAISGKLDTFKEKVGELNKKR